MTTPAVSIVVPFFNPGKFLAEAVESVLAQSFANWELLLINDGSNDGSVKDAHAFVAQRPEQIFLIAHGDGKNHGLPATRNLGLKHCRGEFVALLDADDFWFPEKLEQQVEILRSHPDAGMVFGRSEYWHTWDPAVREDDIIPQLAPGENLYRPPELWKMCYPFGGCGSPCPSDLLLRRNVIEQVGGFEECFDDRYPTHEDIAFLSKIFLSAPVYVSSKCWDRYRRHERSLWAEAQRNGNEERSRAFYFRWMRDYLRKNGVNDPTLLELYRARSWRYRHATLAACADRIRSALRPLRRYRRDQS